MQNWQTAPYSTHNVRKFWVKVCNKVKFSFFHLVLFFVGNGFRPFSFDNLKEFLVNKFAVIPECMRCALCFMSFFLKISSSSTLSEQFRLTLSATPNGLLLVTEGGWQEAGFRYSCESVGLNISQE